MVVVGLNVSCCAAKAAKAGAGLVMNEPDSATPLHSEAVLRDSEENRTLATVLQYLLYTRNIFIFKFPNLHH